MKTFPALVVLIAIAGAPAAFAQNQAGTFQADSLASELSRIRDDIGASKDLPHYPLPSAWRVATASGEYSISTQPLRDYLDKSNRDSASAWLNHAAGQMEGWQSTQESAGARTKLEGILARREFARGGPPSLYDLMIARIRAWIGQMIARLLDLIQKHPATSRILFWVLICAAAAFLIWRLMRLGKGDATLISLSGAYGSIPARPWEEWIAAARDAAEKGDLREAIHCAYWAGVARLQQTGVLSADRTYTPREYLRLSAKPRRDAAAGANHVEHLRALTMSLERFWYADRVASPNDFSESLRHLEGLGCKVA